MDKPLSEQLAGLVAEREIARAVLQSQMDECAARGEIRQYVEFPGWQRYQDARSNVEIFRAANESALLSALRDSEKLIEVEDALLEACAIGQAQILVRYDYPRTPYLQGKYDRLCELSKLSGDAFNRSGKRAAIDSAMKKDAP